MSLRLVLPILSILAYSAGSADWTPTSGPEGGSIRAIAVGESASLAVTYQGEVYRNSGGSWVAVSSLAATRIISVGSTFLAAAESRVLRSVDNGSSWVEEISGSGFTSPAITVDRGIVYACVNDSLFRSLDEGGSWTLVNHVLNFTSTILASGDTILIGSSVGLGLQRSTDGGVTFSPATSGLSGSGIVNSMERLGGEFFVSFGNGGVFRSTDGGASWEQRSTGLPQFDVNAYHQAPRMLAQGTTLYAVANTKVYRYDGAAWSPSPLDAMVFDLAGDIGGGPAIFSGTYAGVWRSTNGGTSWTESNTDLIATTAKMFATIGDQVFTPISNRIARTTDNGTSWTYSGTMEASRLVAHGTSLFAVTFDGVSRSIDNGATWSPANQGIDEYLPDLRDIAATSGAVYASFFYIHSFHGNSSWFSGGVFRSTDNGASWVPVNNGLPHNGFSVTAPTHRVAANGQSVFAATVAGVYRSTNAGSHWMPAGSGIPSNTWVETLYNSPAYVLFGSNKGVFRFNGSAWEEMNSGFPQSDGYYPYTNSFVEHDGTLYAATSAGVYRFDGTSWSQLGTDVPATSTVLSIIGVDGHLLAAASTKGVWKYPLTTLSVDGSDATPPGFSLAHNYPNPFNPSTSIGFQISDFGFVSLKVFDVLGREVATLVNEQKSPGSYTVHWDASGVASGVYLARLESAGKTGIRQMLLMK